MGKAFEWWVGFLNRGCAIKEIWKTARMAGIGTLVSHDSHNAFAYPCGKQVGFVERLSIAAPVNGLQRTRIPHMGFCWAENFGAHFRSAGAFPFPNFPALFARRTAGSWTDCDLS